jgi:NadR type nicotinamide-nucleotide adenylyltransferase
VSGTLIRRDPLSCRDVLAPEVYADFLPRVALLGGESTGKTTLAGALAEALGTSWVPEYGRELWERQGGELAFEDMEHIAQTQVRHEQRLALTARDVLVCDTTPLTTLLYSEVMFGHATQALQQLARRPYALTLLCAPDFAFVQDGTRRDESFRADQHAWYRKVMQERGIEFTELAGPVARRVQVATTLVAGLLAR